MTSTCFILSVATVFAHCLNLSRKPKLHTISKNSDFCAYHTSWTGSSLTSVACLSAPGPGWSSHTQLLPTTWLPVIDILCQLKVLLRFPVINNCWGAGTKPAWSWFATAIKISVNCIGTVKDPLSRTPEDYSRAEEVQMCVKASFVLCDKSSLDASTNPFLSV